MPAGFESFTDDGVYQIIDSGIYFTLSEKGNFDGVSWLQEGNNSGYHDITFSGYTLDDAPMLALRGGATWHTLISATSSGITYRVFRVMSAGASIDYMLFTNRRPNPNISKFGLEVFNGDGEIVFASDTLIARPIGVFSGELFGSSGYVGLPISGRDIAHVPMKQGSYSFVNRYYGGLGSCMSGSTQGYSVGQNSGWQRSAISTVGGIEFVARFANINTPNISCSVTIPAPYSNSGGSYKYSSLILDVTNY